MSVLYIVLPLAILLAGLAVAGFIWAVRGGQFDDVHTPAYRAIQDDDQEAPLAGAGVRASVTPRGNTREPSPAARA